MRQKPMIIYKIKGEKLKIIKYNYWSISSKIQKNIGYISDLFDYGKKLCINPKIEFIKFQNFDFNKIDEISCEKETICILENCSAITPYIIFKLETGNFNIINPNFKDNIFFLLDETPNINFNFNSKSKNNFKIVTPINTNSKIIKIKDNNQIDSICLYVNKVTLEGLMKLEELILPNSKEVIIGNSKNNTEIINFQKLHINTNYLYLNNCIINHDSKIEEFIISFKELSGKNFIIKSKNDIRINNIIITDKNDKAYQYNKNKNYYYIVERDKDGHITITEKDLLRLNLISSLKAFQEKINKNIEQNAERLIQETFSPKLADEILEKQFELNKIQAELREMQEEYAEKREKVENKLIKQLSKRKTGYYNKYNDE